MVFGRVMVLFALTSMALPVWALDWRLEAQFEATRQDALASPLPLVEAEPFSWQQRYDLSLRDSGVGLDLRLEQDGYRDSRTEWTVRQAYYDGALLDYELTVGQKHLHWDYGFLASPLNWVGPADGRSDTLADPLISVQRFRGVNVDQSVCTLRLEEQQEICLVRTQGFAGSLDWQLAAGYQEGWQFGAGASWVFGPRWEYHGAATWFEKALRQQYKSGVLSKEFDSAWDVLLGFSTSGQGGWQLLFEHHLDSRALSADDWSRLLQDMDGDQQATPAEALAPAWQGKPLSANRSLFRVTQQWRDWDFTGTAVGFWVEWPTLLLELEASYGWTQNTRWSLGWQSTPASGMLGRIGQSNAYTLGFNWVIAP